MAKSSRFDEKKSVPYVGDAPPLGITAADVIKNKAEKGLFGLFEPKVPKLAMERLREAYPNDTDAQIVTYYRKCVEESGA